MLHSTNYNLSNNRPLHDIENDWQTGSVWIRDWRTLTWLSISGAEAGEIEFSSPALSVNENLRRRNTDAMLLRHGVVCACVYITVRTVFRPVTRNSGISGRFARISTPLPNRNFPTWKRWKVSIDQIALFACYRYLFPRPFSRDNSPLRFLSKTRPRASCILPATTSSKF